MKVGKGIARCEWCSDINIYINYHDKEWGTPLHDDIKLFELLTLEGAQAGLSWLTVLKRRAEYVKAFDGFDPLKVSKFNAQKVTSLLETSGIIRNKLKVMSVIQNAKAILKIQEEFGSFSTYLWEFVSLKPVQHHLSNLSDIPNSDDIAKKMSKDMKQRGFNFVGPTICYSFMQASGLVNDHLKYCFRYQQLVKGSATH